MPKNTLPNRLLTAMVAGGLMLATTAALAQGAASRAEERRASRAAKNDDAGKSSEARYPDATRKQPDAKASSKMTPKLQKLFDAYDKDDLATAQPIADEIIADADANAYDKSMSARIVGSMLLNGEDQGAALGYLQRAIDFDGLNNNDHYEVMSILAQLQAQDEQYDAAMATLDRMLAETRSQDPELAALKGNILMRQERYPEAIAVLEPLVASPDAKPQWQQMLMAAYAESGQAAEASRLAEKIAAGTPDDKVSQLNLAATYLQTEQYDKAAAVYEGLRAKGELTEEVEYRNLMASYLSLDDGQPKAIEVINEGLQKGALKPDYQTYVALAQAYYFSDPSQVGPAIEAYQKAAPLAPNGETYLNLAKLLSNEGRIAEAKQAAQQALDKGVKSPEDAKRIIARTE